MKTRIADHPLTTADPFAGQQEPDAPNIHAVTRRKAALVRENPWPPENPAAFVYLTQIGSTKHQQEPNHLK
jgi:hypothetical protein